MKARDKARLAAVTAEDKKATDIAVLDVSGLTTVADYFVICNGHSTLQVRAIAEAVQEGMERAGYELLHAEGFERGRWVLLDYGDVIVHVFLDEDRDYYNIERLWGDAPRLDATLLQVGR